jgi:hypothetical protein
VEDMCYERRASRSLCGLVCPSRTSQSEREGEGDCVKEGGGEKWERERELALGLLLWLLHNPVSVLRTLCVCVHVCACVCVCLLLKYLM